MKTIKKIYHSFYSRSTIIAFLFLVILSSIIFSDKNFLSNANIFNILLKAAKNGGFLALGMTFVILCAEIDLSAGAVFALSGVVMGIVGQINPFLGILAGILVGVVSGLLIGLMVTKMRISSWIASLAMMFALRGVILIIAKKSVVISGDILTFAGTKILSGVIPGMKSGISILIPLLFIITFICMYLSRYTKFGMGLYSVGGNSEAARMMGIDVDKIKIKAFICSGLIAALSGVLLASSSGSATLSAGNVYETYAIAMCAIGGVKLSGGVGKFSGTFFGILIYFIINTIFTYLPTDISVHWQSIIMGALVLISVGLQTELFQNIKLRKMRME
jgi:ribose/xylose/arabinose/galactoside ABC-type transport system permease subunit